jgi:hypothetical protein
VTVCIFEHLLKYENFAVRTKSSKQLIFVILVDRSRLTALTAEMFTYWLMPDVTDQIFDAVD